MTGQISSESRGGLTQPSINEDFDPNILLDNFSSKPSTAYSPSKSKHCQQAITLCAKTVLAHLITHLGHFPMAIGAARLSSMVVEHDDVPQLSLDELSTNIFAAHNIQVNKTLVLELRFQDSTQLLVYAHIAYFVLKIIYLYSSLHFYLFLCLLSNSHKE